MEHTFTAIIERFDTPGEWHYATVPDELSVPLELLGGNRFGFIAVNVRVGNSSWPTSLMPKGDKTYFIALPKRVRSKEKLTLGMEIEISFETRIRSGRE